MTVSRCWAWLAPLALCSVVGGAQAQQADMTFFVTSAGSGKGADWAALSWVSLVASRLGVWFKAPG